MFPFLGFNYTGAHACVLAALSLTASPLGDLSRISCRLFTLGRLVALDAAPFDPLATACATPPTLTDARLCASSDRSLPERVVGVGVVHPLYNATDAAAFFEAQTAVQLESLPWCLPSGAPSIFSTLYDSGSSGGGDPELCSCDDILALKTLGSPRRAAILAEHQLRAAAAADLRASRVAELALLEPLFDALASSQIVAAPSL